MTEKSPRHAVTLILLLALTAITAVVGASTHAAFIILGLAMAKILLVAFRFMELRHALLFWKYAFVLLSGSFLTAIAVLAAA
jgi:hypothetical protein